MSAKQSITQRSGMDLAAAIRSGELTSAEVVEAHISRLQATHARINAVAADRYALAREEAVAADARVAAASADEELPPLLGVPCTIKESIALEGMPNCAGLVARRAHRADRDAPTAARLRAAGAIPVASTNTSELTMWIETENRVYGRTRNPYDPSRIAGGSSGGDGAAVGAGGVPFALGADIGGSIRLPAFFNGAFGHKCTPGLVPNNGMFPTTDGESGRLLAVGPIARRAEDLMPVLRAIAGADPGDPLSRDAELGDPSAVDLAGLDVVISEETFILPVSRELREARSEAAGALAAAGARVRHVPLRRLRRVMEFYGATLEAGAGQELDELMELGGRPAYRVLLEALRGRGDHTVALSLMLFLQRASRFMPAAHSQRLVEAGRRLAGEVEEVIGDGVLLHPPFASVAPKHGRTVGRMWSVVHTATFNLLGLPVTEVPLGLNRQGLPLGVQVVGRRGADHVTIAVAQELERVFGGWVPPPV